MYRGKITSVEELKEVRARLRDRHQRVVLTNGCFDFLHAGHIHLLRRAGAEGDVLIVAVNDDDSVRRLKGPTRPIFPLEERLEVLASLEFVDYVLAFSEDTPLEIITALIPDVLVKGGDWPPDKIVGRKEVEAGGGRVVLVPYKAGLSSSEIIAKIAELE